jgi:Uma2 family endonuclease
MIATPQTPRMTTTEYLQWEPLQEIRHEYIDGQVVAMTGGSVAHNDIAINLLSILLPIVRKRDCRINMADVKLQIQATHRFYYPDLMVSCDERDQEAKKFLQYPTIIIEVLSPGTSNQDRGDKFTDFQTIKPLNEYVLVNSEKRSVECYRRGEGRMWLYYPYCEEDNLQLDSLDVEIPISRIYAGVYL